MRKLMPLMINVVTRNSHEPLNIYIHMYTYIQDGSLLRNALFFSVSSDARMRPQIKAAPRGLDSFFRHQKSLTYHMFLISAGAAVRHAVRHVAWRPSMFCLRLSPKEHYFLNEINLKLMK